VSRVKARGALPLRLLLLDPDARSVGLIAKHLTAQGYAVTTLPCALQALAYSQQAGPQLVVLGDGLPDHAALLFCHQLRHDAALAIPLLLLSGTDHFSARVAALDAGADDVLSLPYALEELDARLRALLRRSTSTGLHTAAAAELRCRELLLNTDTRQVSRAGIPLKLTVKEYDLLLHLLQRQGQVVPRQHLLLDVWGDSWVGDDNLLDVYIRYLRKKLERPDLQPLIHTVRGVGFMLQ
jgi:DNA-binding response OmpR family regulator